MSACAFSRIIYAYAIGVKAHAIEGLKYAYAVLSPNIARPLTLRASPTDYATFDQIKSFLIFYIRLFFGKRKTAKDYHFIFYD